MRRDLLRYLLAVLLSVAPVLAQAGRGTINGTIKDPSGAAVPTVGVTAVNVDTGVRYAAASNELGFYSVLNLPIGTYNVQYSKDGFKRLDRENIPVAIGQVAELNVSLQLGAVSESIVVNDTPPTLDTETTQISTNLKSAVVQNLPLSARGGRYMDSFAYQFVPTVIGGGWESWIGGSQPFTKQVLLDGTSFDSAQVGNVGESSPSMEAIQEFQVDTTGISAETARTGGGTFEFAMKSGTNSFHGSGFGFLANEDLNANTWNNNWWKGFCSYPGNSGSSRYASQCSQSYDKQKNRFFDYGASVGGPVRRNKTFFFVTYEKYRQENWGTNAAGDTVPTAAFLKGDFSALLDKSVVLGTDASGQPIYKGAIFDPSTLKSVNGQMVANVFQNNVIPTSRLSSRALKVTDLYSKYYQPVNDRISGNYPKLTSAEPFFHQNQFDVKVDHNFSDRNRLSGSYIFTSRPRDEYQDNSTGVWQAGSTDGGPLTRGWRQVIRSQAWRGQDSFTLSPTLLNVFSFSYNRFHQGYQAMALLGSDQNWPSALGLSDVDSLANFPTINFTGSTNGYSEAGIGNNRSPLDGYVAYNTLFNDSVTWLHGRHSFKFGGELRTIGMYSSSSSGGLSYTFNRTTGIPTGLLSSNAQTQVGFAFANFLLGDVDSASSTVAASQDGRRRSYGFFAQDDIKVSPKLTLNLGLRWDVNGRLTETQGRWANFDPNAVNPAFGTLKGAIVWLKNPGDSFEVNQNYREFGPHVGMAYQLSDKLVLRASYGIFYVPLGNNSYSPVPYGFQTGYVGTNQVTAVGNNMTTFNWDTQSYPGKVVPASKDLGQWLPWGPVSIDPNTLTLGRTQNWNVNVQYELTKNTRLDVSYIGNIGRKLHDGYLDPRNYPTWQTYSQALNGGAQLGNWIWDAGSAASAKVPYPYSGFSNNAYSALQPFPQVAMSWGPIYFVNSPLGKSDYNAIVLQVTHRTGHGLTFDANYALSRSRGNAGTALVDTWGGYGHGYQDPYAYDQEAQYGTGSEHVVKGYVLYELPVGKGKQFLSKSSAIERVLGGWQIGVSVNYASGTPMGAVNSTNWYPGWSGVYTNVASNADFSNTFQAANLAWDPTKDPANSGSLFVNPSNFSNPTYGQLGNSPRLFSNWHGLATYDEDLSLLKNLAFGQDGRYKLQLRGEFFNVLNRHRFDGMNTSLSSAYFAHVMGAGAETPRNGQLGARFEW
jgi:hypothetical protein